MRSIWHRPRVTYYKPQGIPLRYLEESVLTLDEVEAIRLKDVEGLEQTSAAKKMKVSQSTFQRILSSAHKKTAQALLAGKAIRFEGGNIKMEKESIDAFEFERIRKDMCGLTDKYPSRMMIKEMTPYLSLPRIAKATGIPNPTINGIVYGRTKLVKRKHAILVKTLYDGLASTLKTVAKKRKYLSKFK